MLLQRIEYICNRKITKMILGFTLVSLFLYDLIWSFPALSSNSFRTGISIETLSSSMFAQKLLDDFSMEIPRIERVFAISDLHTDDPENLRWLREKCSGNYSGNDIIPGPNDAVIIAGDVSHEMDTLEKTLLTIKEGLGCEIFFISGNHEAWTVNGQNGISECSLQKLHAVHELCRSLGVIVDLKFVGSDYDYPVWILPMESWYDGSLAFPGCEEFCSDFHSWPWVDFVRCRWPEKFNRDPSDVANTRIPDGLVDHFLGNNVYRINKMQNCVINNTRYVPSGLISFTHFLPCQQTLPDWLKPETDIFKKAWFDHGVPGISSKFAKVAGSSLIDDQIRSVNLVGNLSDGMFRRIHVFGHSHRPKDFSREGVRYIHNPLGKSREREMKMISNDVQFQLIWDTSSGEVSSEQIIRYWEEKGGGKTMVWRYMLRRKKNRKVLAQRIRRSLSMLNN